SATRVFAIPEIAGLSPVYFVKLELRNFAGAVVSSNFYWLSTQPAVSNWEASNGRFTPIKTYANFTALDQLPPVSLKLSSKSENRGGDEVERVTVANPGRQIAFFVHL